MGLGGIGFRIWGIEYTRVKAVVFGILRFWFTTVFRLLTVLRAPKCLFKLLRRLCIRATVASGSLHAELWEFI